MTHGQRYSVHSTVMAAMFRTIPMLWVVLLFGCDGIAGGGGSTHAPPEAIAYDQPTPLELELSVWGAGSGEITKRYTEVRCHYKPENAASFSMVMGSVESEADDRMVVAFELPAFTPEDGDYVEYYFDMKLDGHYNKRPVARVPLR